MKIITSFILLLTAGLQVGCIKHELSATQIDGLAYSLISEEIKSNPPQEAIIFVSTGFSEDGEHLPVSEGVLQKLQILYPKVRRISESEIIDGIPYLKSTDTKGVIIYMSIEEIISSKKVSVEIGTYRGFLNSGGRIHVMEFKNNQWNITKTSFWVS